MPGLRIRKSKTALKNALLALMKKKKYSKITIKELCEKAELNRSSFYANYADIQELLLDIHTDVFDEMSQALNGISPDLQADSLEKRIASVTELITYMQDHLDIFRLLLTNNEDNLFEKHLSAYYMNQYVMENAPKEMRYIFLYHAIGSFTLIHQWIADNCPYTPQELAELICAQSETAAPQASEIKQYKNKKE